MVDIQRPWSGAETSKWSHLVTILVIHAELLRGPQFHTRQIVPVLGEIHLVDEFGIVGVSNLFLYKIIRCWILDKLPLKISDILGVLHVGLEHLKGPDLDKVMLVLLYRNQINLVSKSVLPDGEGSGSRTYFWGRWSGGHWSLNPGSQRKWSFHKNWSRNPMRMMYGADVKMWVPRFSGPAGWDSDACRSRYESHRPSTPEIASKSKPNWCRDCSTSFCSHQSWSSKTGYWFHFLPGHKSEGSSRRSYRWRPVYIENVNFQRCWKSYFPSLDTAIQVPFTFWHWIRSYWDKSPDVIALTPAKFKGKPFLDFGFSGFPFWWWLSEFWLFQKDLFYFNIAIRDL